MSSHKKYALMPVDNGKLLESKIDAMTFACALKEFRKLSEYASFHDTVYLEQYSRLLPAWTLMPQVDDEVVLGTWITGGVVISTESFRRLTNLTSWMPAGDLAEIINAARFAVPADAGLLAKRKPASRFRSDAKTVTSKEAVEPEKPQSPGDMAESKIFKLLGRPHAVEGRSIVSGRLIIEQTADS